MIQRKQTLFLILAAVFAGLMFAFPISTFQASEPIRDFDFQTHGLFNAEGVELQDVTMTVPLHLVVGILLLLIAATIFLFKNLKRQLRLVRLSYLITLFIIAFMFIIADSMHNYLERSGTVVHEYGAAAIMPLAVLLMLFLAERGIRSDLKLLKSLDRLR